MTWQMHFTQRWSKPGHKTETKVKREVIEYIMGFIYILICSLFTCRSNTQWGSTSKSFWRRYFFIYQFSLWQLPFSVVFFISHWNGKSLYIWIEQNQTEYNGTVWNFFSNLHFYRNRKKHKYCITSENNKTGWLVSRVEYACAVRLFSFYIRFWSSSGKMRSSCHIKYVIVY